MQPASPLPQLTMKKNVIFITSKAEPIELNPYDQKR
jgi:hypothetical protein